MQFSESSVDYTFDPLKVVDIKTMTAVADNLKKSKDKGKRAIGVFLDRVNRMRTADTTSAATQAPGHAAPRPSGRATPSTNSKTINSSGLRDLRD